MERARGQHVQLVRVLLALVITLVIAVPAGSRSHAQGAQAPDLPAMALLPLDLDDVGLDGYEIGVGNLTPTAQEALWLALHMRVDLDQAESAFEEAGAEHVFKMFLDLPEDPEDRESEILGTVVSYAYAGDDQHAAEDLFDLVAAGAAETAESEIDAETVGDASSLTFHEGMEPYLFQDATWLALHIQSGTDVFGVLVIDYTGGTPDAHVAVELGERLLDRVEAVREGDSPDLAPKTLHLAWDDEIAFPGASYIQVDGEPLPVGIIGSGIYKYAEAGADDEARAELYDEIGAEDVYFLQQQLQGGSEGGIQDFYYENVLLRFTDDAAAEDYLESIPDRLADDPAVEDLELLDEVTSAPDDAIAVTYQQDYDHPARTLFHHATYLQVDDIIARVGLIGIAPLDEEAAAEVADAQAECLVEGTCSNPLKAPAELREAAQEEAGSGDAATVLPPDAEVAGLDLAGWMAREFQWSLSIPDDVHPSTNPTEETCGIGQSGPVFFLPTVMRDEGELRCTVPEGVALFLVLDSASCSTIEPASGEDEDELRSCVEDHVSALAISELELTVDGEAIGDLASYEAITDHFPIVFAEDNIFDTPVLQVAMTGGYSVLIDPPSAGVHTIEVRGQGPSGADYSVTYVITVTTPDGE